MHITPKLIKEFKKKSRRGQLLDMSTEKIMGFAYANDHHSPEGAFRYTANITVLVLPECQGVGVGKTLLDRLLFCLERYYKPQCQVDFFDPTSRFTNGPEERIVHRILAAYHYAPEGWDEIRSKWMSAWLEEFDFKQYGEEDEVGCKKNLSLNRN